GETWTPTVMTPGADANCAYDDLANEVHCVIAEIPVGGSVAIAAGTNTAAMDDGYGGTTLSQTAVVASINGDNNLGHGWGVSNVSETVVVCDGVQVDDISIALSGPAEVKRGDAFTYQMTITNTGDVVANEIRTAATLQNTGADWTGTLVAANPAIGDFPGAGGSCSFVGVSLA